MIGVLLTVGHQGAFAKDLPELVVEVSGKGQPMIMIPGLTCDGAVWDSTLEALGDEYEYHVLTLPGFAGQAPLENVEAGFFTQIRQMIFDYIEEQELDQPIIVGHSLGGFLALQMAIEKPDFAEKMVIVDALPFMTAVQMPDITAQEAKGFAQTMKTQMKAASEQSFEQKLAYQKSMLPSMINDEENIEIAAKWGAQSDMTTVAQAMYEMNTTDIREDLDQIEIPILVLGAWITYKDFGSTRQSVLNTYTDQYKEAKEVIIDMTDKGKHFIMWDDPEFFQAWLKKFL